MIICHGIGTVLLNAAFCNTFQATLVSASMLQARFTPNRNQQITSIMNEKMITVIAEIVFHHVPSYDY